MIDLQGMVQGQNVQFTKTYDGKGGYSHSVTYFGALSGDGRSISGTWELQSGGQTSRGSWQVQKNENGQRR